MKPVLKWAGGKSKISNDIMSHFTGGDRLVEPFVGSGAIFLNSSFNNYLLCDSNIDLINLYNNLKHLPEELIKETKTCLLRQIILKRIFIFLEKNLIYLNQKI